MQHTTLIQVTDADQTIINNFSCLLPEYKLHEAKLKKDHEDIDTFLKESARRHHENHYIRTHLLVDKIQGKVIGFFSVLNESIVISRSLEKSLKFKGVSIYRNGDLETFPAIRLHQFALHQDFHGQFFNGIKYSDYLFAKMLETVHQFSLLSGCSFIGLEATQNAIRFYEKRNFKMHTKSQNGSMPYMIFKVTDLFKSTQTGR